MSYTEQHFTGCKYNPLIKDFSIRYKSLFDSVPAAYEGDAEKLLRYVCLMYDPGSPLVRDTSSFEQRIRLAAQYAGYTGQDNIDGFFELTDVVVVAVIDHYMKHEIHERLWYMIQGNEQTFYEYGKRLIMPVKWDDDAKEKDLLTAITIKTKLSEDMASINKRLEDDYKKLYADDANLIKAATKKKFSPEDQASRIK